MTSEDVKRILGKYFTKENRTVAFLVKPEQADSTSQAAVPVDSRKGSAR